jgi:CRISPR locus-related DNA-binding protein
MQKSIFLTLGWSTTPAVSAVVRHGIKKDDELILLLSHLKDEQAEAAVRDVKSLTSKLSGVKLKEVTIPLTDFSESVATIKMELDRRAENQCIMNLSGGMRVLVLAAFMACTLCKVKDLTVEIEAENRSFLLELPILRKGLLEKFPVNAVKLLQLCLREENSVILRQTLKVPPSTFHEYVTSLERAGLLERERRGKLYNIRLTELGRLVTKTY